MRTRSAAALLILAIAALAGCDRADSAAAAASELRPSAATPRTAGQPPDACGWIPAAEVEAIIGPLAGPPKPVRNGCLYPVPLDSATANRRAAAKKLDLVAKDLEKQFGPLTDTQPYRPPPETAVIVQVAVGQTAMDRALTAGFNRAVRDLGPRLARDPDAGAAAGPPQPTRPPDGWDRFQPKLSFLFPELALGVGHLTVRVVRQTPAVSGDQALALADRIRERIPDVPFGSDATSGAAHVDGPPADRDPCGLLRQSEAETVLGKLAVPPYRALEGSYLAHEEGPSCAYFTTGHRALVLTPTWEYGGMEVDAMQGVGALIGEIAPALLESPADTLDEVWEEVGADAGTGELYFLQGERLLRVGYLASSTDANGAVRLARLAMRRLTAGT
jgi:hypothetical protein